MHVTSKKHTPFRSFSRGCDTDILLFEHAPSDHQNTPNVFCWHSTALASSRRRCAMSDNPRQSRQCATTVCSLKQRSAKSKSAKLCRQQILDHFLNSKESQRTPKYGRHSHPKTVFWLWHRHRLSPSKFMMRRHRGSDSSSGMGVRGPRWLSGTRSSRKTAATSYFIANKKKQKSSATLSFLSSYWRHRFCIQPVLADSDGYLEMSHCVNTLVTTWRSWTVLKSVHTSKETASRCTLF